MSERVKELAEQAGVEIELDDYGEIRLASVYGSGLEKFAELIVRECLEILSKNNPCPPGTAIMYSLIQDEYFDKGWQVAVETKSNQIKKHFGVDE